MPTIRAVDEQGHEFAVEGTVGATLMSALRESAIRGIDGMCGGCCSCATCHVWIDPEFADRLEPMSSQENDILDGAIERRDTSRLSCQIVLTDAMDGLRLGVAPPS